MVLCHDRIAIELLAALGIDVQARPVSEVVIRLKAGEGITLDVTYAPDEQQVVVATGVLRKYNLSLSRDG